MGEQVPGGAPLEGQGRAKQPDSFDIITGEPLDEAHQHHRERPRRTLNWKARQESLGGDNGTQYNLIAGRLERTYQPPLRDTAATLQRPEEPALLRTRPW